jgi:hypothetical protein
LGFGLSGRDQQFHFKAATVFALYRNTNQFCRCFSEYPFYIVRPQIRLGNLESSMLTFFWFSDAWVSHSKCKP